jgi:wobble nucleotide-excising tRNase
MIKNLKIFRLNKNKKCSEISEIDTADIQNSYQTFWTIVKDSKNHPALVANCMRQILEYFFNFTERIELKELFEKEALKSNKYIAFNRYINRESHSTGDNIFDIKEFDYDVFKEAFCLVFKENGYENHYK